MSVYRELAVLGGSFGDNGQCMQFTGGDFIVDTGIYQFVSLDRGQAIEDIADNIGDKLAFATADFDLRTGHAGTNELLNLFGSHKVPGETIMKSKTILQEAPGKTMLKVFFWVLLIAFCITQVRAGENLAEVKTSSYISLGKPMVLNLSGGKRLTFLQISADVLVSDSDAQELIEMHIPAMRHSLIMLLSEKPANDIKSPARREEIRQQAATQIKQLIADLSGSEDVADVLFSSILVQ